MDLNLPNARAFVGPAPLMRRFLAFMIDLFVIDLVLLTPFQGLFQQAIAGNIRVGLVSIMFAGMLALLYFSILEYRTGLTVGKLFTRIQVVPLQKDVGFLAYFLRSMWLLMVFPFILLWLIDPISLIFTDRRVSEMLSRTRTVARYSM